MSSSKSPGDKPQIEIVSDEDWKSRVKAEDAKRDAELAGAAAPAKTPPVANVEPEEDELIDVGSIPDASFATLLQMLSTQAILSLGLIPGPEGEVHIQLPLAKHFIDLLAVLETKCKGNLTADESRFLDGTLHELRIAFVEVSKNTGKSA
ncbi:DUF1844 domain-containing protein [Planctomicrobium piriforme]|uniref:DUF1844 domain-containing protein n=1 Tax=Planctomicrobium piriforme TaxID=1576369 RepID=A0A1I3E627_9PLAN|nr:DUF1844 domain-containing protein [Planctomicrobium piriforme]SFH94414.1 protein of unknown function [Planctomicrobium piriforme]